VVRGLRFAQSNSHFEWVRRGGRGGMLRFLPWGCDFEIDYRNLGFLFEIFAKLKMGI